MTEKINGILDEIERREGVKIIFAAEAGSRAKGYASAESDFDVRFVYIRPREFYLRLDKTKDVIEWGDDGVYDVNGWDIQKALRLLYNSNPSFFEWASSPVVYRTSPEWEKLSGLMGDYFSPKAAFMHYYGIAKGNYRDHLKGEEVRLKKYIYAVSPLLCCRWITEKGTFPPLDINRLISEVCPDEIKHDFCELIDMKKQKKLDTGRRIDTLGAFIEDELCCIESTAEKLSGKSGGSWEELNSYFLSIL
ncbi:MAG: nucleotidyltransferase domain-containing protein [Ruminococcus sp.]|nr:nucleotidyltransferase domain-containing protein [Ruminococcus sp.]